MSPFPEEPLNSPVGYFPARPNQTLNNGRWTLKRKLGWGFISKNLSDSVEEVKEKPTILSNRSPEYIRTQRKPRNGHRER